MGSQGSTAFALTVIAAALVMAATASAQVADLEVTKTADSPMASRGGQLAYTVTVENWGPDEAVGVEVVDELPFGSTFLSAGPECFYDALDHVVICAVSSLAAGATHDFVVAVTVELPPEEASVGAFVTGRTDTGAEPGVVLLDTMTRVRTTTTAGPVLVEPRGIAREPSGALVVTDAVDPDPLPGGTILADGAVVRVDRASGAQTVVSSAGLLVNPRGIVVSPGGDLLVADPDSAAQEGRGRVVRIDPVTGGQEIVSEGGLLQNPAGLALDDLDLIVADAGAGSVVRIEPETGAQTLVAEGLMSPYAISMETLTTAVVADLELGVVRVDLVSGEHQVVAAPDGVDLVVAAGIQVASDGSLIVTDPDAAIVGAVLQLDPATGLPLKSFPGGEGLGYREPRDLALVGVITNVAEVFAETTDPEPLNNRRGVSTELVVGPPPVTLELSEVVVVSDAVEAAIAVRIALSEQVNITDQIEMHPAVVVAVNETVSVTDSLDLRPAAVIAVSEAVRITDQLSVQPEILLQVSETVTVRHSVVPVASAVLVVSEKVTVTDSVTPYPGVVIQLSEDVVVSDFVTSTTVLGDVNGDGVVDEDDVVTMIDQLFGAAASADDVNGDGSVDAGDVAAVVSFIN